MSVYPAKSRQTIQVHLPQDVVWEGPIGTSLEEFMQASQMPAQPRIVAGLINGKLRELTQPLDHDADITPVTMSDLDGSRIYRRSLCFLMIAAAVDVFPKSSITIQHSMPFGGFYCEYVTPNGSIGITHTQLEQLKQRMRSLVAANLPISQIRLPLHEALQLFRNNGDSEKAELFAKRRKDYLTLYELNGVRDYFHGFMLPSTGYLNLFDLHLYNRGFILQFPRRHAPECLQPFEDEPRLAQLFQQYSRWLDLLGIPNVAALNQAVREGRLQEVILIAEALHQRQLAKIAEEIASRKQIKVVFISGPTSAGKTTFSKRLAVQLLAQGIQPVAIAMDNYFVDRERTPRDHNGAYDFEALEAVDVPLFLRHLQQLLDEETIIQPRYNFRRGRQETGEPLRIREKDVLLVEGIHGLNPQVSAGIPANAVYRIFISAFTQLNVDRHNRVPTTDTRLLRRIVRDAAHRGYSAADTIGRWQSVRRGERTHIFPHQNNANVFFNSALVYELSALKPLAEPLLLQVEPEAPERVEANRLLAFLQWFDPIRADGIPSDSILREFIGGSIMDQFEPWKK